MLPRLLHQLLDRSWAETSVPTACLKNTLGCGGRAMRVCCQLPFAVAGDEGGWMFAVTRRGEEGDARL